MPEIIIGSPDQKMLYIKGDGAIISSEFIGSGPVDNPAFEFIYDTYGNVGSIWEMIGVGSIVQVLTWGGGSLISNIGSWV